MNILVVAHYQGDGSPTAIYIHEQIKAYVALGHSVRVISPIAFGKTGFHGGRFASEATDIDGIYHYYLRFFSLSRFGKRLWNSYSANLALRGALKEVLRDFKPDVIHAHTLGLDSSMGVQLKGKLNCPLVVTTHGSDTSVPYEQGDLKYLHDQCEGIDTVVAVSSALAGKLASCSTQVPIVPILNGFSVRHVSDCIEKSSLSIMQVGNLIPQKRVDVTIRAFAAISKCYPDATLTIIGRGELREELENLCRELAVSEKVTFTGQLPNDRVLAEMAKAQFFAMPSVREGFGIVYLEAMASGCVTIGTEGEGIADLVVSGENGFLVPPDDPEAIVRVIDGCLKNPEETMVISQKGQQAARELTWEKNARQYIELFENLKQ